METSPVLPWIWIGPGARIEARELPQQLQVRSTVSQAASVATMTMVITGGTGFVGRHLTRYFLDSGRDVVMLVRPSSIVREPRARVVRCPDWSAAGLEAALDGVSFSSLVNAAAYGVSPGDRDPTDMDRINVRLPANLIDIAAKQGASVVMLGSSSEYAPVGVGQLLDEDAAVEAGRAYGRSKALGTRSALLSAAERGVSLRVLRLFHVYGPGESRHRLLPSLVRTLRRGEPVSLSAGTQIRDFLAIRDTVEAVAAAVAADWTEPVILNICTGRGTTVVDFARRAASILGAPPDLLRFGDLPLRPDDLPFVVGNPSRAAETLNWRARFDLDSGLRDALASVTHE